MPSSPCSPGSAAPRPSPWWASSTRTTRSSRLSRGWDPARRYAGPAGRTSWACCRSRRTCRLLPLLSDPSPEVRLVTCARWAHRGRHRAAEAVLDAVPSQGGRIGVPAWAAAEALLGMGLGVAPACARAASADPRRAWRRRDGDRRGSTFSFLRPSSGSCSSTTRRPRSGPVRRSRWAGSGHRGRRRPGPADGGGSTRRSSSYLRRRARRARCPGALPTLSILLDEQDRRLAELSAEALVRIGPPGIQELRRRAGLGPGPPWPAAPWTWPVCAGSCPGERHDDSALDRRRGLAAQRRRGGDGVVALPVLSYFLVINTSYLLLIGFAAWDLAHHRRRAEHSGHDETVASQLAPGVSVIVPAYNEEAGIVTSVQAMLALRYPRHEVVVVDDGSTDGTAERLRAAFDLVSVERALPADVPCARRWSTSWCLATGARDWCSSARRTPVAPTPSMWASTPPPSRSWPWSTPTRSWTPTPSWGSRSRSRTTRSAPWPPAGRSGRPTAAGSSTGGSCRCGCPAPGWPASRSSSTCARSCSAAPGGRGSARSVLISGAFGMFRRDVLVEVGGLDTDSIGEDFELVMRIHRHLTDQRRSYRVEFVAEPISWTEVPSPVGSCAASAGAGTGGCGRRLEVPGDAGQPALRQGRPGGAAVLLGVRAVRAAAGGGRPGAVVLGLALGVVHASYAYVFLASPTATPSW